MTIREGREVLDYCGQKGVRVAAGLMMRFGAHVRSMKRAVAEGKIGQVVSGYSQFTLWLPDQAGNWRQCRAKSGGGCLMDMGAHHRPDRIHHGHAHHAGGRAERDHHLPV